MAIKLDKTEITVVTLCCLGLLVSAVFIILALVYYSHRRQCMYSIEIPCYTDWRCPGVFTEKNGTTKSDGTDDYVTKGGNFYYAYTHHFTPYYKQCLGSKGGDCSAGSSGALTSGTVNGLDSCNNLDIGEYTSGFNGNFPYGSTTGAIPQPYPPSTIDPDNQSSNSRNACMLLPTPK